VITDARGTSIPERPAIADDFQPVRVDLPDGHVFLEGDALLDAVDASGGKVFIGLKSPSAARTRDSGIRPGLSRDEALRFRSELEAAGVTIVRTYRYTPTVVANVEREDVDGLLRLPYVDRIEPVRSAQPMSPRGDVTTPLAPFHMYPAQDTSWGARKVRAPQVWSMSEGGNAKIIMLDFGVDEDHFLSTQGDINALTFSDCMYVAPFFSSCWDDDTAVSDGHGSHVFGIAAAHDNSNGWVGIAPDVEMVSIRACDSNTSTCGEDAIIAGLEWAVLNYESRQIINMSFGKSTGNIDIGALVTGLHAMGSLVVAAAGDTPAYSSVTYPARWTNAIAVSGTLDNDAFASTYSCTWLGGTKTVGSVQGSQVELSAPFWATSAWSHLRYSKDCGTSASAPAVSAVAALIWTKWPNYSNNWVRTRLRSTSVDLGSPGKDNQFGYGRVDAYNGLFDFSSVVAGPSSIISSGNKTWNAATSPVNGGNGSSTYKWEKSSNGWTWSTVGTSSSYSQYVGPSTSDFYLRVTITSAGFTRISPNHFVEYEEPCDPWCQL
jgi:hypothetical protein